MVEIKSVTPLIEFCKGKQIRIGEIYNRESNDSVKIVALHNSTSLFDLFIHFSSKVGELSLEQIKEQEKKLQVVELQSGKLVLTKKGNIYIDKEFVTTMYETNNDKEMTDKYCWSCGKQINTEMRFCPHWAQIKSSV